MTAQDMIRPGSFVARLFRRNRRPDAGLIGRMPLPEQREWDERLPFFMQRNFW